jgi:hypothetical protein
VDKVRVRFAPSPTGPFHIGGARSALLTTFLPVDLEDKWFCALRIPTGNVPAGNQK